MKENEIIKDTMECKLYKRTEGDRFKTLQHVETISAFRDEIVYEDIVSSILLECTVRRHSASSALNLDRNYP